MTRTFAVTNVKRFSQQVLNRMATKEWEQKNGSNNDHNSERTSQGQGNNNGRPNFRGKCLIAILKGILLISVKRSRLMKQKLMWDETTEKDQSIVRLRARQAKGKLLWHYLLKDPAVKKAEDYLIEESGDTNHAAGNKEGLYYLEEAALNKS